MSIYCFTCVYSQAVIAGNPASFGALPMTTLFPIWFCHTVKAWTQYNTPQCALPRMGASNPSNITKPGADTKHHTLRWNLFTPVPRSDNPKQRTFAVRLLLMLTPALSPSSSTRSGAEVLRGAAQSLCVGPAALTALPSQHPAVRAGSSHEIRLL